MTPISTRYAIPLLLLLALALIPIATNTYVGRYVEDCSDPAALFEAMAIDGVIDQRELEDQHRGLRFQFTHGRLSKPRKLRAPRYMILRTWDPSNVYMQPIYHLKSRFEADRQELEWYGEGEDAIPIYWQTGHSNRETRVVGYIYLYDSHPVERPFRTQVASLPDQLVNGVKPLTFFGATGLAPPSRLEEIRQPIRDWLAASWRYYRGVCSE